jgi:hypothetical protein
MQKDNQTIVPQKHVLLIFPKENTAPQTTSQLSKRFIVTEASTKLLSTDLGIFSAIIVFDDVETVRAIKTELQALAIQTQRSNSNRAPHAGILGKVIRVAVVTNEIDIGRAFAAGATRVYTREQLEQNLKILMEVISKS